MRNKITVAREALTKVARCLYSASSTKDRLKHLPLNEGSPIKIKTKRGETFQGLYIGAISDGLLIRAEKPLSIPYDDIEEISIFWT